MKYLFCFSLFFLAGAFCEEEEVDLNEEELIAADLEFRDFDSTKSPFQSEEGSLQDMSLYQEPKVERNIRVLLFTQAFIPGAGLGLRFGNDPVQYELDASVFFVGAKASLSVLKPFGKNKNWYFGGGIGLFTEIFSSTEPSFYVPTVVGYKGKYTFADIGIDFTQAFGFGPFPNLRLGFCF